jgi:hypothetical protein
MLTAPDPRTLNAASVASTLKSAQNVPLFMGGGQTFTCGKSFFAGESSVCTGAAFLVQWAGGGYKLMSGYDSSKLLAGI